MRYLYLKQITETNQILSQIEEEVLIKFLLDPYSCKSSKKEKKSHPILNTFSLLSSVLELSFPDYNFKDEDKSDNFKSIKMDDCKKEITSTFHSISKEIIDSVFNVIDKSIDVKNSEIYAYDSRSGPFEDFGWFFCYFFYNKKKKRIILFCGMLDNKV